MIYINGKSVIGTLDAQSRIIFTDSASSNMSVVFMDKDDIPTPKSLVWLEIRNYRFDPSKDESEDNPLNIFATWMWVDQCYTYQVPAQYQTDENGNPIVKEDGSLNLGDWESKPGIVRVELYEHKHVLTRQASLDNINILHRLPFVLSHYNSMHPDLLMKRMEWEDLKSFLTVRQIQLDYGIEYEDENENPIDSEYPPGLPLQCMWRHFFLNECLQDLLNNYECRVLSTNKVGPDENYSVPEDSVITNLIWRRRKELVQPNEIEFTDIKWPILGEEDLLDETQSQIFFRTISGFHSNASGLYHHGMSGPNVLNQPGRDFQFGVDFEGIKRSDSDFIHNLAPYDIFTPHYNPIDFTALEQYLKENHVNVNRFARFTTQYLSPNFYSDYEWSQIELNWANGNYEYVVTHEPRRCWFPLNNFYHKSDVEVRGRVVQNFGGHIIADELVDITNNVTFPGEYQIDLNPELSGLTAGDIFIARITGTTFYIQSHSGEDDAPELTEVMHNGQDVEHIGWMINNWNPEITDSELEFTNHSDPNNLNRIFNYTFSSFEYLGSTPFERIVYTSDIGNILGSGNHTNFDIDSALSNTNIAKVIFEMRIPDTDREDKIIEYLRTISHYDNLDDGFLRAMAAQWIRYYGKVEVSIGLSHEISKFDMFFAEENEQRVAYRYGIHPDLDPTLFTSHTGQTATTFPFLFPGDTVDAAVNIDEFGYFGNGMPSSVLVFQRALFKKYYRWFRSHEVELTLTYYNP